MNPLIFLAIGLSLLEVAVVTALMSFFSSFTSPMLASFFTLCVVVSGHLSKDLLALAERIGSKAFTAVANVGYWTLPNLSLFNLRAEAVHELALPDGFMYSVTVYGLFYTLVLLFLSSLIFRARDVA